MFADRKDAGLKLADALKEKDIKNPIVLAIPRGGVEVGYYVAAPVSGPGMEKSLQDECDDVIILEQPPDFQAVAQVYLNWYDVSDREVNEFVEKWKEKK